MNKTVFRIQSRANSSLYWTKAKKFGPESEAKQFDSYARAYNHAERTIPLGAPLWHVTEDVIEEASR